MEQPITVTYERKFSDGNYGSEGLSVSLTLERDETTGAVSQTQDMATTIRQLVLGFLSKSQAERVAWAANRELNPPPPAAAGASLEDMPF